MEKTCNKIVIKSFYGWGAHPQYSDELTITQNEVVYSLKVERMGKLIQKASCELFFDDIDCFESEVEPKDLLQFAGKAQFEKEQEMFVCDGGSLSLTIYYDDGSSREIDAPAEDIKYSSPETFEFIKMLSVLVRGSSINPGYFEFDDEIFDDEEND